MTPHQKFEAKLAETGIPHKEINCYGSQVMITTGGEDSARQWASVLANFAKVNNVWESIDQTKATAKEIADRKYVKVWRVWATL